MTLIIIGLTVCVFTAWFIISNVNAYLVRRRLDQQFAETFSNSKKKEN